MEAKLVETLGRQDVQQPMGQPPSFGSPVDAQLAAQATVASMLAARPAAAQASDSYERSINHAMRLLTDIKGKGGDYEWFSRTHRASIMGFCGVDKWKNVPTIRKIIEETRSKDDLRTEIGRMWSQFQATPDVLYYDVH